MRGLDEVAFAFDAACERAGVAYCFVGALAVMAWGEPRATTDADALVILRAGELDRLVEALREERLAVDVRDLVDALQDGSHVSIFADDSPFYVDLKPARSADEREEVERAVVVPMGASKLRVVPPEETVAYKLLFGSPKDVQDARSILVRNRGALDEDRLTALAARLGVEAALADLRRETAGS